VVSDPFQIDQWNFQTLTMPDTKLN
jgi:hypothetical protein